MSAVTLLLNRAQAGDPNATSELLAVVYDELRKLATARMRNEAAGHTLQPTALVHEAWLQLVGTGQPEFFNRAHFFGAAGQAMRRILIDSARRRLAEKRGGGAEHIDLDAVDVAVDADDTMLLRVDEALEKLAQEDPPSADLVRLRFFVGMKIEEAAEVLQISERTAKRYWTFARAWLYDELQREART